MRKTHCSPSRKEPQTTYGSAVLNIRKCLLAEELPNQTNRDSNTSKNEVVKVEKQALKPDSSHKKKERKKENQMKPDFLVHKLLQTICSALFVLLEPRADSSKETLKEYLAHCLSNPVRHTLSFLVIKFKTRPEQLLPLLKDGRSNSYEEFENRSPCIYWIEKRDQNLRSLSFCCPLTITAISFNLLTMIGCIPV